MRKTAVRAVALAAVCFLSVFGTCSYAKEATSEPIQIVVLGDSIAKGYCGANKPELYCYGQTVAEEIAQGAGKSSQQTADDFGYAKNRTFVVTKAMNLVSRLDTEHIRNCLDILFNADLALKTSAINCRTVLEETIVKLSPEKSRRSYY